MPPLHTLVCRDVAVRLMDYAMDDLTAWERQEVEAHLAACPPCAAAVADYLAVGALVHDALEQPLSAAEQAALEAQVLTALAAAG